MKIISTISPFKKLAVFIIVISTLCIGLFFCAGSILKSLYPLRYDDFVEV